MKIVLVVIITCFLSCEAFYRSKLAKDLPVVRPKTLDELKKALKGDTPRKIVLEKVFDFTNAEGSATEVGCYHESSPKECLTKGQKKLNFNNHCKGLVSTKVTYSKAGPAPLEVGSNKVIQGKNNGGLKGKGLRLCRVQNVEIRNLRITDINPHLIWGGDAIILNGVKNVLIDKVFIKNIGRQMIATGFEACTGITISNSVFDGYSPYSANCKGNHYWLWLFAGEGDMITLQNNVVYGTCGRGPKVVAPNNKKSMIHIIQNTFYDVKDCGLLCLNDRKSCVLMEGNVFVNVANIVKENLGNVYLPRNSNDAKACASFLGRQCLVNTVVNSHGNNVKNSNQALQEFKLYQKYLSKPIDMKKSMTKLITIPGTVSKHIK